MMARRIERLEFRVKLLEEEARGGIDLSTIRSEELPATARRVSNAIDMRDRRRGHLDGRHACRAARTPRG